MRYSLNNKVRLTDIADKAGVSITAVSRVFNDSGYVAEDKRKAIFAAMQELGVSISDEVIAGRGRNRKTFGVLLPPSSENAQFIRMSSAFQKAARDQGYSTKEYFVNLAQNRLIDVLQSMMRDHLNGIYVTAVPMLRLDKETEQFITGSEIPIVLYSEFLHPYLKINSIINNYDAGMEMMVQHLHDMGGKRIAFLAPPDTQSKAATIQRRGFMDAVNRPDRKWDNYVLAEEKWTNPQFSQAGYLAAKKAFEMDPDVDSIVGWTDAYTAGILWYLYEIGRRVPEDVRITCNNSDYAPYLCPPVTSVSLRNEVICSEAVTLLIRLQNESERINAKHIYLTPELHVRRSTDLDANLI